MIGQTLDHYLILARLGQGGMGVVYRARDQQLQREVAVKVLPQGSAADGMARARLLQEARSASALNHPNICIIHDVGEAGGQQYIVMEFVEGRPLSTLIPDRGMPPESVVALGLELSDALAHAHSRGVIHRDLKTSNIVITPEGRAKVLDFGLAKRMRETYEPEGTVSPQSLTEPGVAVGTVQYMSPEALRGEPADTRSDIWSLGVVLYEAASGHLPFRGRTAFELSAAILREHPLPLPAGLSPALRSVILQCLARRPLDRYQNAADIAAVLKPQPAVAPQAPPISGRETVTPEPTGDAVPPRTPRPRRRSGARRVRALAVLPLANLSGDSEQDYFTDGMTDALIAYLAQISSLRVISRTSVMQYKTARRSLPEIARELNVDAIVEGSVLRSGNKVRITTRLVEAATDRNLWTHTSERDVRDVLELQSEIAQMAAREIEGRLSSQARARLPRVRSYPPEVHEAYFRGRHFYAKWTPEGLRKAIEWFNDAIEKEPAYAPAYAGLASCFLVLGLYEALPPSDAFSRARAAAARALALDQNLAESHVTTAAVNLFYEWDWAGAEARYRHTLELSPSEAAGHFGLSNYLSAVGRHDEALAAARQAEALDPLFSTHGLNVGWIYFLARCYKEAIAQLRTVLENDPNSPVGHLRLGLAYEYNGMLPEAIASYQKSLAISGPNALTAASLGHALATAGRRDEARVILDQLLAASNERYVSAYVFAILRLGLGEQDAALEWIEKACEERASRLVYLNVDPRFDSVRSDPRFRAIVVRVGIPRSEAHPTGA